MPAAAGVAQLVEQWFCKPQVGGSTPSAGTTRFRITIRIAAATRHAPAAAHRGVSMKAVAQRWIFGLVSLVWVFAQVAAQTPAAQTPAAQAPAAAAVLHEGATGTDRGADGALSGPAGVADADGFDLSARDRRGRPLVESEPGAQGQGARRGTQDARLGRECQVPVRVSGRDQADGREPRLDPGPR